MNDAHTISGRGWGQRKPLGPFFFYTSPLPVDGTRTTDLTRATVYTKRAPSDACCAVCAQTNTALCFCVLSAPGSVSLTEGNRFRVAQVATVLNEKLLLCSHSRLLAGRSV